MKVIDKDLHTQDVHEIILDLIEPSNKGAFIEGSNRDFMMKIVACIVAVIIVKLMMYDSLSVWNIIVACIMAYVSFELLMRGIKQFNSMSQKGVLSMGKFVLFCLVLVFIAGVFYGI